MTQNNQYNLLVKFLHKTRCGNRCKVWLHAVHCRTQHIYVVFLPPYSPKQRCPPHHMMNLQVTAKFHCFQATEERKSKCLSPQTLLQRLLLPSCTLMYQIEGARRQTSLWNTSKIPKANQSFVVAA